MNYENAPATQLLATHCLCCGRPLVDAVSVESGIGPDCAEKFGFNRGGAPSAERIEANALVHMIAATKIGPEVTAAIARLSDLGFGKVAAVVTKRLDALAKKAKIELTMVDGCTIAVVTPYNPAIVAAFRTVPGRRWDAAEKRNTFPIESRVQLFKALTEAFPGALAKGPKGLFKLPAAA